MSRLLRKINQIARLRQQQHHVTSCLRRTLRTLPRTKAAAGHEVRRAGSHRHHYLHGRGVRIVGLHRAHRHALVAQAELFHRAEVRALLMVPNAPTVTCRWLRQQALQL